MRDEIRFFSGAICVGIPRQGIRYEVIRYCGVVGSPAACSNAARKEGGSDLPRFSARRRIPAQAIFVK
jgi:hypothetical protein